MSDIPKDDRDLEVIRRRFGGFDPSKIKNPDPNFAYRWVSTNEHMMKRARYKGWEPVRDAKEAERLGYSKVEGESQLDGTVHINPDLILAKMPRSLYEKIERLKQEKRKEQVRTAASRPQEKADEIGVPYIGGDTPLAPNKK